MNKVGPIEPRQLPHNAEAEQQLLGALMVYEDAYDRVDGILQPEHFHFSLHREIFEKTGELVRAGKTVSPITLKTFFASDLVVSGLTLTQFLLRMAGNPVSRISLEDYAAIVRDLALRRQIIEAGEAMISTAYDAEIGVTPTQIIDKTGTHLFELRPIDLTEQKNMSTAITSMTDGIEAALSGKAEPVPLIGIPEVDRDLGGLIPTNLILVAGRPGMGKSIAGVHVARRVARQGFGVGVFTLEISTEQWVARLISAEAAPSHISLTYGEITSKRMDTDQFDVFKQYSAVAENLPIEIDDTSGISLAQLETRARKMAAEFERKGLKFGALVVDYVGLMSAGDRYRGNKVQEVSEISAGLKGLAKRLRVPVLALSQLSRGVESRDNKRPMLSDLRDSGSLEQDADQVLFLYRPAYYDERDPRAQTDPEFATAAEARSSDLEWIIAKNRTGPTRTHISFIDPSKSYITAKAK